MKLIRTVQTTERTPPRPRAALSTLMTDADTTQVSRRQWWLLFRNRVFRSFWKRQGKAGDATDSAYEYHLAKASFCCGLNHRQTEFVVIHWRDRHRLNRSVRQLRLGIIPKAWCEVEPWVERWRAERNAAKQSKRATKTANRILSSIGQAGKPQNPSAIAAALEIPRERAKKAMQRMAHEGKLRRTVDGYESVTEVGTF